MIVTEADMSAVTITAVKVPVTQDHIDEGMPDECAACPIALAIADALPGALEVLVTLMYASFLLSEDGPRVAVKLPFEVSKFIGAFDHNEPVAPFTFTLELAS